MAVDIKKLGMHYGQLEKHKHQWEGIWKDVQKLILPYHGRFDEQNSQNNNIQKNDKRIDDTSTLALRVLAAGMQGGLTSPSQRWFKLGLQNQALTQLKAVRVWLSTVEDIMFSHFRRSNFYETTPSVYKEVAGFGTACLFEEQHSSGEGLWFHLVTVGDFVFAPNAQGRIDTVFRRDWLTADQMEERFDSDRLPEKVTRVLKTSPYTYFETIHCVRPRRKRDPNKLDALNMEFESIYWVKGEETALSVSGFTENPYTTPRWFTSGSMTYGVGPGIDGMPTIRGSNSIKEDLFKAVNKEVDPPTNIPESLWGNVDLDPGGENPTVGNEKVTATYQISPNLAAGGALSDSEKQAIRDWFFVNLFILATNPNATATEIAKKAQEQLIQLGPVLQKLFGEFLIPTIDRSFNILFKQGLIPLPPPELEGQNLEIEFISTLAQAQKMVNVEANERYVSGILQVAQTIPSITDNVDWDEFARSNGENMGVQPKIIRSIKEIQQIREVRAQQQQQDKIVENMEAGSRAAMNFSNAKLEGDSVGKRMVEANEAQRGA